MKDLTHTDAAGRARMVEVASKNDTARTARAEGSITMSADALDVIDHGGRILAALVQWASREAMGSEL